MDPLIMGKFWMECRYQHIFLPCSNDPSVHTGKDFHPVSRVYDIRSADKYHWDLDVYKRQRRV